VLPASALWHEMSCPPADFLHQAPTINSWQGGVVTQTGGVGRQYAGRVWWGVWCGGVVGVRGRCKMCGKGYRVHGGGVV